MNFDHAQLVHAVLAHRTIAIDLFKKLSTSTADDPGITRISYGPGEQLAHELMQEVAESLNLEVTEDHARNLYMTLPGLNRAASRIITGSHLDSVPKGGNYDGAAGVIGGLIALSAIKEIGLRPERDLTVMAIRAEESAWFPQEHVGSRAALGMLAEGELDAVRRVGSTKTLGELMELAGCDTSALRKGTRYLDSEKVHAFFELHIEQGPILVEQNLPLGIVTAIRGNFRAREAVCIGTYGHSGAVPSRMRRDAVLAAAELVYRLETMWREIEESGEDLVLTVGKLNTNPEFHAISKIPGEVTFTLEVRSTSQATLNKMMLKVKEVAASIGNQRDVAIDLGKLVQLAPAHMALPLRKLLKTGCERLSLDAMDIASGSGHDAAEFARANIPSAMIFIRNPNGSHNPSEDMDIDDFLQGIQLLAWTLIAQSNSNISV